MTPSPAQRGRVGVGVRLPNFPVPRDPPHPNPLPAFGGPKVRLSRQRKLRLRVSRGERELGITPFP
ncbi:hypothetical protein GAY31_20545 [Azospirillum brasilense]|nr:hypothetical protein [Azospirillum brasilense]